MQKFRLFWRLENIDRLAGQFPHASIQKQYKMNVRKTYATAVVLIPPEAVWDAIQKLRRVYDRHFDQWMPHITLLYPFAEREDFTQVLPSLAATAGEIKSFHIHLARFSHFRHRRSCTIFLVPELEDCVINLHASLVKALPDYDDTAKYPGGFQPHLSIGQFQHKHLKRNQEQLQAGWTSIEFVVEEISLICRAPETEDRFVVAETFPLSR